MVKAHSLEVHEFRLLQFTGELGVGNLDVTQAGAWEECSFLLSTGWGVGGAVNLLDRRDTRKGHGSLDGKSASQYLKACPVDRTHFRAGIHLLRDRTVQKPLEGSKSVTGSPPRPF